MKKLVTLSFLLFMSVLVFAQVTTSKIKGYVYSQKNDALIGATVVVTHEPTGTEDATLTMDNGAFFIPNLRVGGPYTVKISYIGYKTAVYNNVYLQLGKSYDIKSTLQSDDENIEEVVISVDRNAVFDSDRTGSTTGISSKQLSSLPSISRSAEDFYRLDPTSSGGSFAGRNDQFNNFSLDGSIFNNPFGLDAATPGGQSNAQPISLEAIEQIQVSVAPYDVTLSGFTGAAINAVTKSGTNEFHGSLFGYYRNQAMTGKVKLGETVLQPDLSQDQEGFSLGGPILKKKLFFFVNFERDNRSDLGSYFIAKRTGLTGENVSRVTATDLDRVSNLLNSLGYETGPYEGYIHKTYSDKGIIKLDWNAVKGTRISFIYNYLNAYRDLNAHPDALGHRGPDRTVLQFRNSGYRINNKINSFLVEANSIFAKGKISNKFQAGYTLFNDFREPFSSPAPVINIFEDNQPYIIAGHEPFSIHNVLDQKVTQITNNLTYYADKHTVTAGVSFEKFHFNNNFNLFGYGFDLFGNFASVDAFADSISSGYVQGRIDAAKATEDANKWNITKSAVGQLGVYIQDEWSVLNNFNITLGLRIDKPLYFNTEEYINEKIEEAGSDYIMEGLNWYDVDGKEFKVSAKTLPDAKPMFAPRLGFNWDVFNDNSMQIRGGSGIFNGRLPYVWIGNHVANLGRWYMTPIAKDFSFPQVWRTSIGVDYKLLAGLVATVDFAYTKDINGMMVRDYGLNKPSGTLNSSIDKRPVYQYADKVTMNDAPWSTGIPADLFTFTNTNVGHSYFATFKLQKLFKKGFSGNFAYNYSVSKDANSIEAEITGDAFARNPALGNVNIATEANSLYGDKHRIVGYVSKSWTYGKDKWSTIISAFYEMAQGGRFSYTYSGDINGDNSGLNDLIYIPKENELSLMTFSGNATEQQEQRDAFNSFIKQDKYLNNHRGEYMERYAILSPWRSRVDVKLVQTYNLKKDRRLEFDLNILNFANLLNSNWGVIQLPVNKQPIGVSIDGSGAPVYSFDKDLKKTFTDDYSLLSRWQMQVGLRFVF